MSNEKTFHLAADIINTTTVSISQALSGGNWSVRAKNDELRLDEANWSVEIYPGRVSGNFLVSGEFDGTLEGVTAVVESMAKLLSDHGIVSNFEFSDDKRSSNQLANHAPQILA